MLLEFKHMIWIEKQILHGKNCFLQVKMDPQVCLHLNTLNYEYVILRGKRNFGDVIEGKDIETVR